MALTPAAIAGIVAGIIIFLFSLITVVGIILHHRHRAKRTDKTQLRDNVVTYDPNEPHLPGPTHSAHRRRNPRSTYDFLLRKKPVGVEPPIVTRYGEPSSSGPTSTSASASAPVSAPASSSPTTEPPRLGGWKKRRPQQQQQQHERFPSLEHGPGPTIYERRTLFPLTTASPTPPETADSTGTVVKHEQRPGTSDSTRPSSLRQAVLDVGGGQEGEKKAEKKIEANVGKKMDGDARPKGYSGAWP